MRLADLGVPFAELDVLLGMHTLDAVDVNSDIFNLLKEYNPELEVSATLMFRLDGVVYCAVEDPNDGYRSSMEALFVMTGQAMKNVFTPCYVEVRWMPENVAYEHIKDDAVQQDDDPNGKLLDYHYNAARNHAVEMIDVHTRRVVLAVGTTNVGDYYPGFVADFKPQNMKCNQEVVNPALPRKQ